MVDSRYCSNVGIRKHLKASMLYLDYQNIQPTLELLGSGLDIEVIDSP